METLTFTIIFLAFVFACVGAYISYLLGRRMARHELEKQIPEIREEAIKKSRAVLTGQFSEQLAPYLPDFPYKPTEVRFIGKPIDFLVFEGMDDKDIQNVVFVEVKSANAKLSTSERTLKKAIEEKRVRWEEYRMRYEQKEADNIEERRG